MVPHYFRYTITPELSGSPPLSLSITLTLLGFNGFRDVCHTWGCPLPGTPSTQNSHHSSKLLSFPPKPHSLDNVFFSISFTCCFDRRPLSYTPSPPCLLLVDSYLYHLQMPDTSLQTPSNTPRMQSFPISLGLHLHWIPHRLHNVCPSESVNPPPNSSQKLQPVQNAHSPPPRPPTTTRRFACKLSDSISSRMPNPGCLLSLRG